EQLENETNKTICQTTEIGEKDAEIKELNTKNGDLEREKNIYFDMVEEEKEKNSLLLVEQVEEVAKIANLGRQLKETGQAAEIYYHFSQSELKENQKELTAQKKTITDLENTN